MIKLSVIIPFRCENESTNYLIDRLENLLDSFPQNLPLEFIVVDSGSTLHYQEQCQSICEKYNTRYVYHDTLGKPFSIGACRDFGVQIAQGKAVSFLDVDLRVAPDFWQRLLVLMEAWGISKYKKSFLAIPCLYLTQEGTVEFLQADPNLKFMDFYLRYLQGDKIAIENMALCSSVMIVDRNHYLSVGGHDPEFRGHGYEDFELYHRLLCEENIIPKTEDYYLDQKTWNTYSYNGFRSHLAMAARPAMMANLFVTHLWHPRPKNVSFYSNLMVQNRTMWADKFKKFAETSIHPETLSISNANVLFFGKPNTNAAFCLRDVFPFLGKVTYVSEYDFINKAGEFLKDDFEYMLKTSNISKIIFPNPYGNPARLEVYKWCRESGFPFYCYERGALPDSWFFDPNGFNADSYSYAEEHWNKPLSEEQTQEIKEYINNCIFGTNFLEKQSNRIGSEALANKLQIGSKKVLFVPLQRPSDTVIKYMSGNIQTFLKFIETVDSLAQKLMSKGWVVLCKKHPLETETPPLKYAKYVPDDTHFIDLLELADRVALINSGVGIYSMMLNKPTYIFGDAFYAHKEVNRTVPYLIGEDEEIENLAKDIIQGFDVNNDKMLRFLHYLVYSFYSFGIPKTISRKEADGSLRTITTGIDFYNLKLDEKLIFEYESIPRPKIASSAPMFERYALDIHLKKKVVSTKK
ncbi:glycosyltransferase [Neisseria sp. ZJ106]|uniref:Glycosyltransferase n=1 Tax=Neisseria lisongii TaxID=2912188 RepID=A0ABY7RK03_9NEIS|nr:glycosyltransferase [Neisseria lisongii]MCF7522101.1 glycosyltransferase [Neisseria lisongii]WCL71957.1 glycosyltransferase [Neisseria lisongii]